MKLPRYVELFRTRWWMIVLIGIICAVVSYGVSTKVLHKSYTASATFEVNFPGTQALVTQNDMPALVATDAELMTSYPVAQRTVNRLHLGSTLTARGLIGRTACTPADLAQTFSCTVTYSDPAQAVQILNTLGAVAIATNDANQTQQLQPLLSDVTQKINAARQDRDAALQELAISPSGAASANLTTRIDDDNATLQQLQQNQVELQQQLAAERNSIILLDPAQAPSTPSSPRPLLNTIIAALVGVLLGVGGVLLVDYLDDSPHSPEHLATELGAPIFATLPRVVRKKGQLPEMVVNPHSDAAEAYRILRTSIRFANVDSPIRSLVVTSSTTGEGKTTTASNLAVTFAQAGVRVVLIDADLRRPNVHEVFDLDNSVGLTSVLYSQREIQWGDVLQPGPVPRLHVLTAGPLPPNPAELLSSRRMSRVMDHLRGWAELIIVDAPPLLAVADPVVLALMVDAVLLVTDVENSSVHSMQRSRESLASVGAKISGIVLNKVPRGKMGYYDYSHDGYHSTGTVVENPNLSHVRVAETPSTEPPALYGS